MELTGARIAVTGAGGFIGAALSRRLVAEGAEVVGLEVSPQADARVREAGAEFRRCDVTDAGQVERELKGCIAVVHTAALLLDWAPMEDFVHVNVGGTANVLHAAEAARVERVVHLSSIAIWGYQFDVELDDDTPPRPCGVPYIDTKGASDRLARARGAVVVRPGDVYGPGSVPWTLRPLEEIRRRRLVVPSRGIVTPVYVDDLVDCIVRALQHDDGRGQAFTAWDGSPVATSEFFDHYARMLGRRGVPTLPPAILATLAGASEAVARLARREPPAPRWAIGYFSRTAGYSTRRAREVLGWEPQVSLEEGMRRTGAWLREQGLVPASA